MSLKGDVNENRKWDSIKNLWRNNKTASNLIGEKLEKFKKRNKRVTNERLMEIIKCQGRHINKIEQ